MPQLTPYTKKQLEKFDEQPFNAGIIQHSKLEIKKFIESTLQEQQEGFVAAIKDINIGEVNRDNLLDELKKKGLIS